MNTLPEANIFRKSTYFYRWMIEEIFPGVPFGLFTPHLKRSPNNIYRARNPQKCVPDKQMYIESGAAAFFGEDPTLRLNLTQARERKINIPMAINSGYVKYNSRGLMLDAK